MINHEETKGAKIFPGPAYQTASATLYDFFAPPVQI